MNGYSVRTKENNIVKMKLVGKKIVMILMVVSLSLSMVSWQNFWGIFAAVATYGRTDDGVWAYKILNEASRTVSICPSDLGQLKSSKEVIPSSIVIQGDSYTVTEIAPYAYNQCVCTDCLKKNKMSLSTAWEDENGNYEGEELEVEINEVVVPSTIEVIGYNAFEYVSLSKVTFEKTSSLTTIGEYAFSECTLKNIEIPASVTTIESGAFSYSSIQTITFEEGSKLEQIAENTFEESNLKTITLPESITSIGEYAFLACKLKTITIPASVTTIAPSAFQHNTKLKEVNFAKEGELGKIQKGAFMECALTEVTIPASVTTIGICAFGNNSELKEVTFTMASEINKLNVNAFARITNYDYEVDDIKQANCKKNTSVTQVNVENYDVYQWIANNEMFSDSTKIYSTNTRVFLEQQKDENVQDDVVMKGDKQATIHLDDYVSAKQGYHFEGSQFKYSDTLSLDQSSTGDIEGTDFISYGYPYVVIKANQEANKYEIAYDTSAGETTMENTKCQYDEPITISSNIPTRIGYDFKGWSKDELGDGELYQPGAEVNENFTDEDGAIVKLYAIWELATVPIHLEANGGVISKENIEVRYGTKLSEVLSPPEKYGYEFLGWSLMQEGEILEDTYTVDTTEGFTLYAQWKAITKRVTIHFSTPENKSDQYGFEIVITRNGETIQQHDIGSSEVGDKEIVISGAKVGETYVIKCTNYEKENGKKKYYQTTTKEVIIE